MAAHISSRSAWKHGLIGGLIAGLAFGLGEMTIASVAGDPLLPLKMLAGLVLQRTPDTVTLGQAIAIGGAVHFAYACAAALHVSFVIARSDPLHDSPGNAILFSVATGFVLWPLNTYLLAPLLGAPWYITDTDPLQQFFFHVVLFGLVLGGYLALTLVHTWQLEHPRRFAHG